jgi:hypothetical protein
MHKHIATHALFAGVILCFAAPAVAASICGDVNVSGDLTTSDALAVLRAAVGQPVDLQCPATASPVVTGQTTCYSASGSVVSCAGTGQDGEFEHGIARSFVDNNDGTITDNATGLSWEKLSDDGSIHDWNSTYDWTTAVTTKVATLNSSNFGGHNDWRVPNVSELRTLLNMGASQPATWSVFDTNCTPGCTALTCSCTQPDWYWSSTTYEDTKSEAWFVDFYGGYTDTVDKDADNNFVRAVRGGM